MKKIVILGHTAQRLDFYRQSLAELLPEAVSIETRLFSALGSDDLEADVAVLTSPFFIAYTKQHLPHVSSVVLAYYTLEEETFQQIRSMERTGPLSIVGDGTLVDSNRKMMLLEKLGIRRSSMTVWHPGIEKRKLAQNVLLFGRASLQVPEGHKVLLIPHSYFSVSTILEIFCALGMPELLTRPAFQDYYRRMRTELFFNPSITVASYHEDVLDELAQEGLMLLSSGNIIEYCDRYAEKVVGIPQENLIGKNLLDIFPSMDAFSANGFKGFQERVITYRGRQYIVSINVISHHQDQVGYLRISNYWEQEKRQNDLRRQLIHKKHTAKYTIDDIAGISEAIQSTKNIARRIALSEANVLITGETGVGKELFAQAIHNLSGRKQRPFVAVNCGAIAESLLESELFGYEGGAFTGARKEGKLGLFELAHTGTLFLDEIGDMPPHLQVRLLRALQEKEITRVGGDSVIPVDVRVIAATNKDLGRMIQDGAFRSDLYYRLNVLPLSIPPLRERKEDIIYLIQYLKDENNYHFTLSPQAVEAIISYPFEGNVRELANCVEYLANLGLEEISSSSLPVYIQRRLPLAGSGAGTASPLSAEGDVAVRVLGIIRHYNTLGLGAGRRSIRTQLQQQGRPLTESAVREILEDLADRGLISVFRGRRGIELTPSGRAYLG